jgi:hypothetical protein
LPIDHRVEKCYAQERNKIDEDVVEPVDVNVDVAGVGSQLRCCYAIHEAKLSVRIVIESNFEEAWYVVADGEDDDDDDVDASATICA